MNRPAESTTGSEVPPRSAITEAATSSLTSGEIGGPSRSMISRN